VEGVRKTRFSFYHIDEFLRTKIFVVGENVKPSFISALMFKGWP